MRLHRVPYVLLLSTIVAWLGLLRGVGEGITAPLRGAAPSLPERAIPSLPSLAGSTVPPNPQRPSSLDWFEQLHWMKWAALLGLGAGVLRLLSQSHLRSLFRSSRSRKKYISSLPIEDINPSKPLKQQQENQTSSLQPDNQDLLDQIQQIFQNNRTKQSGGSHSPPDDRPNQPIEPITIPSGSIIRDGKPIPLAQRSDPAQLLVDMYNRNPSDLRKVYGVVPVSIAIDAQVSLWVGKTEAAVLQEDRQGNYWVIEDGGRSYLVPKGEIRVNSITLEPLALLYDFKNQADVDRPLKPTKVAVVSRLPDNEGWQLAEKGSLQFGEYHLSQYVPVSSTAFPPVKSSLPDKARSPADSASKLQDKINQLEQISSQQQSENQRLQATIDQLETQLKQLTEKIELKPESRDRLQPTSEPPASPLEFDSFKSFLLNQYNREPKSLRSLAIEVSLTENSLGNYRSAQAVIFKEGVGSYWLFRPDQQQQAYLVPKANFRFNTNNLDSVKVCFNFSLDSEIDYSKLTVVSPVIVLHIGQGKEWQLQERGWLEFQSTKQENPDA